MAEVRARASTEDLVGQESDRGMPSLVNFTEAAMKIQESYPSPFPRNSFFQNACARLHTVYFHFNNKSLSFHPKLTRNSPEITENTT